MIPMKHWRVHISLHYFPCFSSKRFIMRKETFSVYVESLFFLLWKYVSLRGKAFPIFLKRAGQKVLGPQLFSTMSMIIIRTMVLIKIMMMLMKMIMITMVMIMVIMMTTRIITMIMIIMIIMTMLIIRQ